MGILNVTPDSFSGDGLLTHADFVARAVAQGLQMIQDGADLLDIGGESSRPGATMIDVDEEIRRTQPVIAALRAHTAIPVAIDTVKAAVAQEALRSGATIVNDISALRHDPTMATLIVRTGASVILMHNTAHTATQDARIGGEYQASDSTDIVADVGADLAERAAWAESMGILHTHILLDPGLGFGKSVAQNLALLNHLPYLKKLGYPVLVGPSRKSFIGRVLDQPIDERLEGTAATVAAAIMRGADIVRVHDVKAMARVARMTAAICAA